MGFKHIAVIALLVPFWAFYPEAGISDRIVLKDGTVEESDKIWTSDKFVHFILKGTQFVEIRYAIDIVERVERDQGDAADPSPAPAAPFDKPGEKEDLQSQPTLRSGFSHHTPNSANQGNSTEELRKIEQGSRGMSFYDPRRALRYQVTRTSAHNELQSALNELAKIYGRTPDWVAAHMGEENDIQIIHQNLIGRRQAEMASQAEGRLAASESAAETPVRQPIPGALEPPASDRHLRKLSTDPDLTVHRGIKFYDPRRKSKYWTAKTKHHNSLQEAVADLARQYNVTPKWIEDHVGESNLLIDIHQNIRNSLPRE